MKKKKKRKKDFNSLGFQNVSKGMLNCMHYRFLNWVCTCNELAFFYFYLFIFTFRIQCFLINPMKYRKSD